MSEVEYRPPATLPPDPDQVAAAVISELQAGAEQSTESLRAAAISGFPRKSGRTAASIKARARQTDDGYDIELDAGTPGRSGTRAHVVRFLERGTGERGPRGRRIPKRKRGYIPSHDLSPTGRGQRPQRAWTLALKRAWKARHAEAARMGEAWERALERLGVK